MRGQETERLASSTKAGTAHRQPRNYSPRYSGAEQIPWKSLSVKIAVAVESSVDSRSLSENARLPRDITCVKQTELETFEGAYSERAVSASFRYSDRY